MSSAILIWLLLLPFGGALLLYLVRGRAEDALVLCLPAGYLTVGAVAVFAGRASFPLSVTLADLPWLGRAGDFTLRLDALSSVLLLVVLVVGLLVMAFSVPYMGPENRGHRILGREGNPRYYFFLSLFVGSMVGVALAGNLLVLFFFWECTTLCSWALISHHRDSPVAVRAGFKALVMTHVGGAFFAVALGVLFGYTGSFEFGAIKELAAGPQAAVFVCLLVAATAKAAQVPLFTWLPDAMEAPTPISAYLHAAAMVKAGIYLMARIILDTGTFPGWAGSLMAALALVTIVVGLIFYVYQDDLKRFLAFSTITQLGYMMLGLSVYMLGSRTGYVAAVFQLAMHAVGKALLFLCVGAITWRLGVKSISKISGLYTRMPLTAVAFFVGLLAVTGIPPFSSFWSKLTLVVGIFQLHGTALWLISVPFYLEVVLAFFWFLRVGQKVLFGPPSEAVLAADNDRSAPGSLLINVVLVVLMVLTVAMPLIVYPFVRMLAG